MAADRHQIKVSPMRLDQGVLADLDYLAQYYTSEAGFPVSRVDVVRKLIREMAKKVRKVSEKKIRIVLAGGYPHDTLKV